MQNLKLRCCSALLAAAAMLGAAAAQTAAPPPSNPAASQDDRIRALEDRIIALEGELRLLKSQMQPAAPSGAAASVAQQPAAVPAQPEAPAQEPQVATAPQLGGAVGLAKALNPDISVIGDFLATAGNNPIRPVPAFEMHESEVGLQAIIDPYARGDFFLSFGEEGVELEEGYVTFTALPAGLVLRGGKMRSAFGKVNTLHNHVLPWTDRPLVTENLVGGEDGISDAGLSLTRNFAGPKGLFLEGTAQVFRGDSSDLFKSSQRSDLSVVGHLRGYKDLTESTNLDLGGSFARGHNDLGHAFLTQLYGVDATLRWKPLRRAIYHSFVGRGEFIWSRREQVGNTQRAFGFYTSADYQFARRWFAGVRVDSSDRAQDAALADRGTSLTLTYWPSEFSQIRTQYRFASYAEGVRTNELRLQLQFSLGAHGAHPF